MIIGLTGLGLCLFVLVHMLGNLLILSGPSAYNGYAHKLHEFPLFILLELGLAFFFVGHIVLSLLLQIKNRTAKGENSFRLPSEGAKQTDPRHNLLWLQGGILLLFLIFHLASFKFGPYYETTLKGEAVRDIYRLAVENFKKPVYCARLQPGPPCFVHSLIARIARQPKKPWP